MIKVASYINTIGCDKYRDLLYQQFSIDMLYPLSENTNQPVYFYGWYGKNMLTWYKFQNENNVILEFYDGYYLIKLGLNSNHQPYRFPTPKTIGDFISDMYRLEIQLYWTTWILINFEPKEILNKNEIKNYYINLLNQLDKSNELL